MKTWAEQLPRSFKECRSYGHAWTTGLATRYRVDHLTIGSVVTCERCNTSRLTVFDKNTFDVVDRKYDYPDDYSKPTVEDPAFGRRDFTQLVVMSGTRERSLPKHWEERLSGFWRNGS
ncbi:MAG: hypothetical protein HKN01_01460 [Acidimicrobiia bacterium]|nr:hypothetical protein [Acidimicrobiia bacterium]